MQTDSKDWDRTVQEISNWLVDRGLAGTWIEGLFQGFCEQLVQGGVPLWRGHLAIKTLHPMFEALTVIWYRDSGVETVTIPHGSSAKEDWQRSALHHMLENQLFEFRHKLEEPDSTVDFPFLEYLRSRGGKDYLALLTSFSEGSGALEQRDGMIASWTSDREEGFSDAHVEGLKRLQRRLALAVKIAQREQTAENVVSTYLGTDAGRRVLAGQIRRGDGEVIRAAIWYCDLRESTALAEKYLGRSFLEILNTYFECTAGAVLDHGGEVLRFIGDAVLAIFPIDGPGGHSRATRMALAAARDAQERMSQVNSERERNGEPQLAFGLGLHLGEILYGNIGVPERVEFSVIGPAANEVARLEDLTKELGHTVVISAAFSQYLPMELRSLGRHQLRGVSGDQEVFTLKH